MFVVIVARRLTAGISRYQDPEHIGVLKRTRGTETSKYPEERKSTETPLVVASERGPAEPGRVTGMVWKGQPQRVTAPYRKLHGTYQVGRDTCNPV